ncbi:mechanosensitive ion channel family protein [Zunongwangia sp. SCSIO 43204]|uniref:mechanosensitive ion channel family protein n=1 Tax=Zunongwangia sp. SCSIO 43204 TaxID=2779359 RepID=UPI001CA88F73|nr:mechanosensitive ion channel family protein [Zunongwangia sp. SCSIO 43204]UAB82945.1 mechanosensitive ion channel family protein [Zunongwangia sp. SCSIO 43204]
MRFLFLRLVILSLLFFCFQHEILNAQALERDSINNSTPLSPQGFPVIGKANEELFSIFQKSGDLPAAERASIISERIQRIDANTFSKDSLQILKDQERLEVIYGSQILLNITNLDTIGTKKSKQELANFYAEVISANLDIAESKYIPKNVFLKIGFVALILLGLWLALKLIAFLNKRSIRFIESKKDKWLKSLTYNNYTFITPEQELNVILFILKILKWFLILLVVYIFFPLIFSVFEFTQGWSNYLFDLIFSSFGQIFTAIWHYFPNIIKIAAIIIVMRYFVKAVRYIFAEIEDEKLQISGFHPDWAMPTFTIIRFLLYAFMFVLIFPLLPGSDSTIFKGVSVFLGVLLSLGSSSAIANMVAGLVITYMRPFKIGDRINIGNTTGNVIEKTLLVTRLKTIKNEEITIPNSAVLSGNTVNYSTFTKEKGEGLIINTTVTLGYDIPYKTVYAALIEAALRTNLIEKQPKPFVLQTSLDDFYVSYQLNAYTKHANKQALIYSDLHQNIQDCCNEMDIEILSPHYRAQRDGNMTTIPKDYLPNDYEAPSFNVKTRKSED